MLFIFFNRTLRVIKLLRNSISFTSIIEKVEHDQFIYFVKCTCRFDIEILKLKDIKKTMLYTFIIVATGIEFDIYDFKCFPEKKAINVDRKSSFKMSTD